MNVTTSCQHILVWGGIVRGSVTMAIAYKTLRRGENDAGLEFEDYSDSTSPTMVRLTPVWWVSCGRTRGKNVCCDG